MKVSVRKQFQDDDLIDLTKNKTITITVLALTISIQSLIAQTALTMRIPKEINPKYLAYTNITLNGSDGQLRSERDPDPRLLTIRAQQAQPCHAQQDSNINGLWTFLCL